MEPRSAALFYRNMNGISIAFPQFFPYGFQHSDDIAQISVRILDTHIDNTAVVWDPIKFSMNLYPPLSEHLPDVPGKNNICPALIRDLMEDSIIFKYLSHLNRLLNLWFVLPGVFILAEKLLLPFVLILRMLILPVLSATYTKGTALKQDCPIHQNPHGPADCVPFSYVIPKPCH